MKIVFASAEIFPFAKSGGLADIAHALPAALGEKADVTVVMPLYRFIDKERFCIRPTGEHFVLNFGRETYDVEIFAGACEGKEVLFVYNRLLCDRDHLYGPPGEGYEDNDVRFSIFCRAIVELVKIHSFEIMHLNDWHTALAALIAHDEGVRAKIVYTIHNLAYQGIFPAESLERTGIAKRHFNMEELEFYGEVNWMKGGIAHADAVTTVSPSYAVEIQEAEYGCGLDGFMRKHNGKLKGILNGIDYSIFDPLSDPSIPERFDSENLEGKSLCKESFLREAGFDIDKYELPLFIFIGRFTEQKGIELIVEAAKKLARLPLLLAILGEGERKYREQLRSICDRYPNIAVKFGYDEALSRRMYAAADFLLMPSRFEPCGLNQMIAMRYGAIPVVHAVGGLRDTVHPIESNEPLCGLGFRFEKMEAADFLDAVKRALSLYAALHKMQRTREFDMSCDFSVGRCAKRYLELYRSLL
ncbi:glycogen synthase, ADP-glucose transglucosylase [Hydrogenimonas sp.]|nr:glycogen synthase, ADP-glucose transglucosylase [Hydrogenimonas sp.]